MNDKYIDIVFEGDKFSPGKLAELTGLSIETLAEFGQIAKRGRYKGKPSPFGLGILKIVSPTTQNLNKVLENAIDYLFGERLLLKECGVDEITLDLENFHADELKIDKEIIKKISELNTSIEISATKC